MDLNQIVNNKLTSRWTKFWLLLIFIFVAPFGIFVVLAWWLKRTDKVKSNQKKYFWLGLVILLFLAIILAGNIKNSQSSTQTQNNFKQTAIDEDSQTNQVLNTTDQAENSAEVEVTQPVITVTKVVDGDTIELSTGETVRYIGIDTPETVDPKRPVGCYGKEASNKNKELVLGKAVTLEKDVSETDKYGRLLRYVYVDSLFVNDYLVRQGFAKASSYPPDVKYQDQFRQAEQEARENNRGLWSDACEIIEPTTKPVSKSSTSQSSSVSGSFCKYACSGSDRDCRDFATQAEAQQFFNCCGFTANNDPMKLDSVGIGDGVACESLP